LKKQERVLIKKIENTKSLIKETQKNEALTISQLSIIKNQISYREELIRNYNAQIKKLDQNINDINRQVYSLSNTNKILIEEYKNMLLYAFKNRDPNYKFLYIISSSTFSEAFHRMKYIQHYASYRNKQVERIEKTQELLIEKKQALKAELNVKEEVIDVKNEEKNNYIKDKSTQEEYLIKLKNNESNLVLELENNNQKRREIARAVKKAIAAELKAIEAKTKTKFKSVKVIDYKREDIENFFLRKDWGISHSCFESEPFGYSIFQSVDYGKLPIIHKDWCKDMKYPFRASTQKQFQTQVAKISKLSLEQKNTYLSELRDYLSKFSSIEKWRNDLLSIYNQDGNEVWLPTDLSPSKSV